VIEMRVKIFRASNTTEALRMVKEEMGPEAVILRTRTLERSEADHGRPGDNIEVTAAVDYDLEATSVSGSAFRRQEELYRRWNVLEKELCEIKDALWMLEAGSLLKPELYFNKEVKDRYSCLRGFGLNRSALTRLMSRSTTAENGAECVTGDHDFSIRRYLLEVLDSIRIGGRGGKGDGARIVSFLGPTGVGKTTSMAKLAALAAVKRGKRVAMITLDTFRIAAVAQMETYARIMSVPLEVATTREELQAAVSRHSDCDAVFIDTIGRSPNNMEELKELKDILSIPEKIHHYLVLSATTQYENLIHAEKRFNLLPFDSYIFTKLDEAEDPTAMINFLVMGEKPVSFFTMGQQVPEDIEPASKRRLAAMMLNRNRTAEAEYRREVV